MALAKLKDVLVPARAEKYGVGAYDFTNMEMMLGILDAAEQTKTPVIIQFPHIDEFDEIIDVFAPMMVEAAKRSTVPVVLHLDHGKTFAACKKCADVGFTSVMLDASTEPFEKNVALTRQVVAYCKPLNVDVEAEIGHVGEGENLESCQYTDPDEAQRFVEETGVDALAVSIGNAHGAYKAAPKINYEVLTEIEKKVSIPLVLHGGSGISDEDFKKIIKHGIAKINIFTELTQQVKEEMDKIPDTQMNMFTALGTIREGFKQRTLEKIKLFETKPV